MQQVMHEWRFGLNAVIDVNCQNQERYLYQRE